MSLRSTHLPHPIATAFFSAFDDAHCNNLCSKKAVRECVALSRIRNSLGWRTRYSSSALYPISLRPVETRTGESCAEDGDLVSFNLRQVFPGQSRLSTGESSTSLANGDDCDLGTGATVWPGSIVLLKYLEKLAHDPQEENVLEGKAVVDLGCGTAVTSIAAALLGANFVVCTDGCDPVLALARQNIQDAVSSLDAGGSSRPVLGNKGKPRHWDFRGSKMYAQRYRWGEGVQHLRHDNGETTHFDVILGADCIVPNLYPMESFVGALDELFGNKTIAYLSYEQRHFEKYDPAMEFRRLAGKHSLEVEVIPNHELHPIYPANDIEIWKVTRSLHAPYTNATIKEIQITDVTSNHQSLLVKKHF